MSRPPQLQAKVPPCGYCAHFMHVENADKGNCMKSARFVPAGFWEYEQVRFVTPTGSKPWCPYKDWRD
jgi:hypothetical protein